MIISNSQGIYDVDNDVWLLRYGSDGEVAIGTFPEESAMGQKALTYFHRMRDEGFSVGASRNSTLIMFTKPVEFERRMKRYPLESTLEAPITSGTEAELVRSLDRKHNQLRRGGWMNTEKIQKICDDYLAYRESEDYFEDNDWQYYIYEVVLKAVYGNDIFDKLRETDKQKGIRRKQKEIEKLQAEIDKEI